MGNNIEKNLSSCCSNEVVQSKKEVSFPHERLEFEPNPSKPKDKATKPKNDPDDYDFPHKRLDASQVEFRANINYKDFNRLKHLEQICSKAPQLVLRVLNSSTLARGTELRIDAQGIEGSLRGKKDGVTYFGSKKKLSSISESGEAGPSEIVNDYIIRTNEPEANEKHRGRHFQIEYALESDVYKIRDLGIGFGTFVKVDHPLLLRDNNLLSMGNSFLIVNLEDDQNDSLMYTASQDLALKDLPFIANVNNDDKAQKKGLKEGTNARGSHSNDITIKIFGGPNYGEVYNFSSLTPVIKIGRMPDCEIKIDDNLMSKYQASIKYVPNSGWRLYDGYNDKPSTNSNWLYLNDDFEMYDGMIFKANHTLFEMKAQDKNSFESAKGVNNL